MQTVDTNFDPWTHSREIDLRIRFELLDTKAREAAVPTVNSQAAVTQLAQLTDAVQEMEKYASLEPDFFVLDGSCKLLPDDLDGVQTGWWSEPLSGADGQFQTPPSLHFGFGGAAISSIGFTLIFDVKGENYPSLLRVICFAADGVTVLLERSVSNHSAHCVLDMPLQNYYAVRFDFLQTSKPQRRIRLCECLFGIVQNFDRHSLTQAKLDYGADLLAESFPSRQLDFSFNNADRKYNLVNPNGLYAYLQEGQDIFAEFLVNGVTVSMARFEFMRAQAKDDAITGEIRANDAALAVLETSLFDGGSSSVVTLQSAVQTVLSGISLAVSLERPNHLVCMAIPKGTSRRTALRLLAQAAMCSLWIDRADVLQMRPLLVNAQAQDHLDADRMSSMAGICVSEPVDRVVLRVRDEFSGTEEHVYTAGEGRREKSVDNPCVTAQNGAAVARWLLEQANRRVYYEKENRGNPAIEVADTLQIFDAYGENRNAVVTGVEFAFDGGMKALTKAVGA